MVMHMYNHLYYMTIIYAYHPDYMTIIYAYHPEITMSKTTVPNDVCIVYEGMLKDD